MLGYVQARVIADACRHVPVERGAVIDGVLTEEPARTAMRGVLEALRTV